MTRPAPALHECVIDGYREYRRRFRDITRRAADRFEAREWAEGQEDARERIFLYDHVIRGTLERIREAGCDPGAAEAMIEARRRFGAWARSRSDCEIAETFYNSVVRRLNGTVGVDRRLEFVGDHVDQPAPQPPPLRRYDLGSGYGSALEAVLGALPFTAPWHERALRIDRAVEALEQRVGPGADWTAGHLELLEPVFFRNKGAYLVGRLVRDDRTVPVVLALLHPPEGLTLDAILTTSDEASVVFGFTRSYLHADIDAVRPVVDWLHSIMPLKRIDELYTAIGFNRHGKTEFYRTLLAHLREPDARFEFTPGKEGLVMIVFTLPELNAVFKVIRDQFGHPKKTSKYRVKRNYGLIFVRDRVGRLADAQVYERLEFPRDRFAPEVLDELLRNAANTTELEGDTVVIEHLYTQRKVYPLDLFLEEADPENKVNATLDFGQAIKDLAAADIFPGDMLLKNFGVTRHGRVIFYDYDEVAPLSDCRFRNVPDAAYPEAELAASPHFYVGPDDVFPEEWRAILGPKPPLRAIFHHAHSDLFDPAWWRDIQARQEEGEVVDFYPYRKERRLGKSPIP